MEHGDTEAQSFLFRICPIISLCLRASVFIKTNILLNNIRMKQYNKINNLVGWLTFLVAAITYCMTIEPTASFGTVPNLSLPDINWK